MAGTATVIEFLFHALRLIPAERHAKVLETSIHWNYTTVLSILFLAVTGLLIWRFLRTGGPKMMAEMS